MQWLSCWPSQTKNTIHVYISRQDSQWLQSENHNENIITTKLNSSPRSFSKSAISKKVDWKRLESIYISDFFGLQVLFDPLSVCSKIHADDISLIDILESAGCDTSPLKQFKSISNRWRVNMERASSITVIKKDMDILTLSTSCLLAYKKGSGHYLLSSNLQVTYLLLHK